MSCMVTISFGLLPGCLFARYPLLAYTFGGSMQSGERKMTLGTLSGQFCLRRRFYSPECCVMGWAWLIFGLHGMNG